MIALLMGLFGRYANILTIGAFIAVASAAGLFWLQAHQAEKKIIALAIDKERLEAAIDAYKLVVAGKQDAIDELEATTKQLDEKNVELNSTIEEIRNAPASDNGPIAPVLGRTLNRLDAGSVRPGPKPTKPKGPVRHK